MGYAISNKVMSGMYAGFSKAEMMVEWQRYKAALQSSSSRLIGSSINGQSFQFGPRGDMNLVQWGESIRYALAQVDPDYLAPSSQIEVRFA